MSPNKKYVEKRGYIERFFFCSNVHKLILLILHLILLWIAYMVFRMGTKISLNLKYIYFIIGDLSGNVMMLESAGIVLVVGILLFGIPAILTENKKILVMHMSVLTLVAAFLGMFLCVFYTGMDASTISKSTDRFNKELEKGKLDQDVNAVDFVGKTQVALKCCGFNSSNDYEYGVMESCCTYMPCREENTYKVGCAEALTQRLQDTLSDIEYILPLAMIYILFILLYLLLFSCLVSRKKERDEKKAQEKKKNDENIEADSKKEAGPTMEADPKIEAIDVVPS